MSADRIHPVFWVCVAGEFFLSAVCVYGGNMGLGWAGAAMAAVTASLGAGMVGAWYGASKALGDFENLEPIENIPPKRSPWGED